nr:DNA-directed DNA polymerase [Tanacetum cinerariifolium]
MYDGAKTRVRTTMGNTEYFSVKVGLHQGSAISPYLFTLILDELSRGIQENIPWCMIFAEDIVLIAESAERLNNRLESWRKTLEDNGLRVSREKMKYLRCDFGRAAIRPAMLCGSKCWPITKALAFRVEVAELRMLRWTCSKTMVDMISNEVFRATLDVDSIIDKIREGRLRWFGHVKRRPQSASVRRVEAIVVEGSRKRGRPKLRWEDRLKIDMKELHLSEDMTSDRNAWRDRIRISRHKYTVSFLMDTTYWLSEQRSKQRIEELNLDELSPPIVTMADQRTMAQLLQGPTEGYGDAIVVPAITADNFELKHGLLTLVQNKQFKDLLRACPHHGFLELHRINTFYNALNSKDQDSLNSAAGVVAKVSTNTSTSGISPDVAELKDMVKALLLDKKGQNQSPATMKAVEESCVTCGGAHSYRNFPATDGNVYRDNIENLSLKPPQCFKGGFSAYVKANDAVMRNMQTQGQNMQNQLTNLTDLITKFVNSNSASTSSSGTLPSNTIANSRSDLKAITTRSGVSYDGPQILPSTSFLPKVVENELEATKETVNPTNNGSTEDVQPLVVQNETLVTSPISEPVIAPVSAPKPNPKSSIPKLSEMARTPLNEHLFAVLLKKLPEKLGDPGKFLIPCDFPGMAKCLALAYLGASINLMPFSVWKRLSLLDLTPTCMTLELADRLISRPVGVAEDVYVKVGSFHFPADFVVVDFDADPRVPLILGRSFLKIGRALIDVFEGFSNVIASGNPTANYDPIVSTTSSTLTPFENNDFLLKEVDAFLLIYDDPTSLEVDHTYLDPEGDILLLEAFLNDDPSPPPNQGNYQPKVRKELKIHEAKSNKSSIDEPPEVKLKDLPPHLEYAFLEGDDKLSVIIAKDLSVEEKTALITVLKSHKRAIAWKLSDIKSIDPEFCTHKILMEEDFEPAVQHQRRVNPKIHDVIKQEVIKLLEAGLIYPFSNSPWVSPVHCIPKKGGFTVVENKDNELISTRLVTGWCVCIVYRKLNEATRKDHFPLPFMDQMLERLAGNQCMMAIFRDMIEKTMEVFMDDFSVFRNSFQSCLSYLERMLKRCENTNLCLNWEKSHFIVKEGIVLGHNISKQGIEVDKAKVDAITKLPHPTNADDPTSQKRYPFIFSNECVEAFQTLKIKLTEAPILIAPDWDMPFELMCDASDFAIGAVLGQRQDKHFRPIHYASKTMTEAESNYTTTKKEMLAVVYAFEKFRSYLIKNKSIVYTDHFALKYLFVNKNSKARLLRWNLLLHEFTFKVIDTKGAENLAADHLS